MFDSSRLLVVVALGAALAVSTGCSHAVVLNTNPAGAKTTINGQDYGPTPVTFTDNASTGKTYQVTFSKEGYKDRKTVLVQEGNSMRIALSVVGGILCLVPFVGLIWGWELPQSTYDYELEPAGELPRDVAPPPGRL